MRFPLSEAAVLWSCVFSNGPGCNTLWPDAYYRPTPAVAMTRRGMRKHKGQVAVLQAEKPCTQKSKCNH